jgi:hypothetical protein
MSKSSVESILASLPTLVVIIDLIDSILLYKCAKSLYTAPYSMRVPLPLSQYVRDLEAEVVNAM